MDDGLAATDALVVGTQPRQQHPESVGEQESRQAHRHITSISLSLGKHNVGRQSGRQLGSQPCQQHPANRQTSGKKGRQAGD
jgi:hypothetical protein